MTFFLFHSPVQEITLHLAFYLLKLFSTVTVSQAFLIFDDLDSFQEYCSVLCRISLDWDFSWLHWNYGLLEEDYKGKVSLSSHHIKGACYQHVMFVVVLQGKITFASFPSNIVPFGRKPMLKQPMLKEWGVEFHLLESRVPIEIICSFSVQKVCLFPTPLIYLTIYLVSIHLGVFILYFGW